MAHPFPRAAARIIGRVMVSLLLLAAPPGCQTEPPPPYVRLGGAAPGLTNMPESRAWLWVFWASWCPPCREELPSLLKLAEQPPEGLRVVVFSHDTHLQAVEAFLEGPPPAGLHLRMDEAHAAAGALGIDTLPASILVIDGRLTARFSGSRDWDSRAMRRLLEKLLQEPSPQRPQHVDSPPRPQ
ncbi:TlpA disulfide reductase family protein [Stigmatella sp. ncwal1]|uniref:TlpA disulfide reductase family protein n=1 Tax=Stigmatella ashevillensis TaxID=2995309 RepID=A0ABT5DHF0_9BACT|nr:TlpA disulfide reductase family protein [Stigmatella ashevillena]MDC0713014.1 TlpA disulfide reductase family protein [Stigmatella ashevillena]